MIFANPGAGRTVGTGSNTGRGTDQDAYDAYKVYISTTDVEVVPHVWTFQRSPREDGVSPTDDI